ncbi:glutamate receptor, ionotropic, n-methyl d-aspartate epsilon [Nesidiocoris tenuis]|uniref:Glutamate receptor, ionotropic, n-methyl d-aspartate epsilon n=1 Tax=Nesidiocoris tenuis TaxID=355587 RepID=A0ABN7BFE7_9HEMI|nr:glutamate receptor, ionotropic, n-methyl d-aspartate epsilon [Nesidiocoris tenuis]
MAHLALKRYLRNVSVAEPGKPNVEFTADGVLKAAELKIMNLRPGVSKQLMWEEIGVWKSWEKEGLDIKDIVWPGNSHTPPQGVPEKFHLKITFLEEPPYISLAPPDPVTGKCHMNRGVICRVAKEMDLPEVDITTLHMNSSYYKCCSGFCIDLLVKFADELGFTYELVRVDDGRWGTLENGKWNGLIADLANRKTDMVMTSLMINSEREAVVDFSVPFMETGIAIVVAKRTGIISPTAFLEPFDTASWMLVGVVAIQAATFTIFLFEWLSPSGFGMKCFQPQTASSDRSGHRFSLFRTYWLVWAVLFQAAVHVDSPRGFTSKFMTNMWAMFAVVFLAIYTANLAAFMITREEYHEFSGIDDHRLSKPYSHKPTLKFGTIPWSHTDSTLKKYFKEMHTYMKPFNRSSVVGGVEAVVNGDLDAFIYDGTVLDYLTAQDEDCRLLTVGSWYAKTGYGLAFTRNSKYLQMFNKRLLDFRENGDLERLRRYWMTGTCKPGKEQHKTSDPLALEQFLSAFLLLMMGILLATLLLFFEHLYFKYVRKHLAKKDRGGCCALVSLSMGKSLTFRGAVFEAQDILRHHRCQDPICDTHLWKVRHELDLSRMRIRQLEKEMEAHGVKPSQSDLDFNLEYCRLMPRRLLATAARGGGMGRTTTMPALKNRGECRSPQRSYLSPGSAWGPRGRFEGPKLSPFQQSMPAAWRRQYFRKSILRSAGSMEIASIHAERKHSRDRDCHDSNRGSKDSSDPGEGPSSERSERTRHVLKTDDGIEINVQESERVESIEEEGEETFRDFDTPHLSRSLTTPNPRRYRRVIKSEGEGSTESAGSGDQHIQFALSERGLQRGSETSEEDFKQTNFRRMTVYDRRSHFRRSILKARQQQGSNTSSTRSQGSLEQGTKPASSKPRSPQHPFVKPVDNGLGASLASPPAAIVNFFPRSEGSLDIGTSVDKGHSSFESDPGGRAKKQAKQLTLMACPPEKTKSQQLLKTDNSLELGVPSRGHHSFESDPGTRAGRQAKGALAVPSVRARDMQRSEGSLPIGEHKRRAERGPRHAHSGPIPPHFQRIRRDLKKEMAEAKKFAETGLKSKSGDGPISVRLCSLKRKNGDGPESGNNGSPSSSEGFIAIGKEDGNKEFLVSLACYDRYMTSTEMLRTRDLARNCIASTEYEGRFCASTPQLYSGRTEIAEMETVL